MKLENQCSFFGLSCPSNFANARFEPCNLALIFVVSAERAYLESSKLDGGFRHNLEDIQTIACSVSQNQEEHSTKLRDTYLPRDL